MTDKSTETPRNLGKVSFAVFYPRVLTAEKHAALYNEPYKVLPGGIPLETDTLGEG